MTTRMKMKGTAGRTNRPETGVNGEVRAQGELEVHHGQAYALTRHREVWHAVHSLRAHASVVLSEK